MKIPATRTSYRTPAQRLERLRWIAECLRKAPDEYNWADELDDIADTLDDSNADRARFDFIDGQGDIRTIIDRSLDYSPRPPN